MSSSPTNAPPSLDSGRALHRAGRLEQAEAVYRQVLQHDPANADALQLLGAVVSQTGRPQEGVGLIEQALALKPDEPRYLLNLGIAWRRANDLDRAIECYCRAIALKPDLVEAHYNLGVALQHTGRLDESVGAFRRAVELEKNLAEGWSNLGAVLRETGRPAEALPALQKAIEIKPHMFEAHINASSCLIALRRHADALRFCDGALELKPDSTTALLNKAAALRQLDRLDEAIACAEQAAELDGASPEAHLSLGNSHYNLGQFDTAMQSYDRALALKPDLPEAHWCRALLLLLQGEMTEGWQEYAWFQKTRDYARNCGRNFAQSEWDGGDVRGRTVLIYAEQGRGDFIQFIRYVPLLKERGARVVVECHPELVSLLRTMPEIDDVVAAGGELPPFDVYAAPLSLPRLFGTTLETIPARVPYLSAPADQAVKLPVPAGTRLKAGFVWAGDPSNRHDHMRSVNIERLLPLFDLEGVVFYSLQVGPRAPELRRLPNRERVVDLSDQLSDYGATAAAIMQLDVVISVDTSVAHLAGALARPVWTLLPSVPEWCWLLGREDSPWYPTMRLLRQPARGDWDSVVARVAEELVRRRDQRPR